MIGPEPSNTEMKEQKIKSIERGFNQMKVFRSQKGFTLVEIMIVVAIIGILAAIAIPNFIKARVQANAKACINNLKQLDGAKQQYALEFKLKGTEAVGSMGDLTIYLRNPDSTACPTNNGAYTDSLTIQETIDCPNFDDADPEFSLHKYP